MRKVICCDLHQEGYALARVAFLRFDLVQPVLPSVFDKASILRAYFLVMFHIIEKMKNVWELFLKGYYFHILSFLSDNSYPLELINKFLLSTSIIINDLNLGPPTRHNNDFSATKYFISNSTTYIFLSSVYSKFYF